MVRVSLVTAPGLTGGGNVVPHGRPLFPCASRCERRKNTKDRCNTIPRPAAFFEVSLLLRIQPVGNVSQSEAGSNNKTLSQEDSRLV